MGSHLISISEKLFQALKECIVKNEQTTSMKQGLITLIPKPGTKYFQGLLLRDKRRQSGFLKGRSIHNIRLVLDVIDYSYTGKGDLLCF